MNPRDYLGTNVTLKNGQGDTWTGMMVAYSEEPSALIEQSNGVRIILPARFLKEREPWHDAKDGEVWELTSSENRQYPPGLWAVVSDGKFVFKSAFGSGFDRIYLESNWEWKRVYPELAPEEDNQ